MVSKGAPTKAPGFFSQVTAPLVSAVASSVVSGGVAKSQSQTKSLASKAGPSNLQPMSGKVSLPARYPVIAALQAIEGPDTVLSATNLMLVTTTFPKSKPGVPGMENRYVTGLQGNVTKPINTTFKGQKIHLDIGDQSRIRWDFDPGSLPDPTKNNIEPGQRNSDRYEITVRDMLTWLDYQTKANTTTLVFTMKERTGVQNLDKMDDSKADNDYTVNDGRAMALKEMALKEMAQRLAQRWKDMYASAPKD